MPEIALPPSDEPFDFRRQAASYGRWRRDYSAALYDAIEARTGPAAGRRVLDVGCGTGFVTATLGRRGWRVTGVDFSAPMLAEARATGAPLVRARGEFLPVDDGSAALVTAGTAFHWLAPMPALAEFRRVLEPGGWAAVFWRYPSPDEPSMRLVAEVLSRVGTLARAGLDVERVLAGQQFFVHPPDPLGGAGLACERVVEIDCELRFTPEEFHGYVSTLEWIRRLAGAEHAEFLARLRDELERRHPDGFVERNREYLFLAQNPGTPG